VTVLAEGRDFYAGPRLSPDGGTLAWLTWDLPRMPWDGTTLWRAPVRADGTLGPSEAVAGGEAESVFQPEWSPDGMLHFVSDRDGGWWNLFRLDPAGPAALCPDAAEYGLPQWGLGMRTYGFAGDGSLVAVRSSDGFGRLGRVEGGAFRPFDLPYTDFGGPVLSGDTAVFTAAAATTAGELVRLDLATGTHDVLRRSVREPVPARYLSRPEPVSYPTGGGATAHAFLYRPANGDAAAPAGTLPPLIVRGHGGPTGQASSAFSLAIQYWTSRGFAVLDVNYRGSTGYGRAYREALYDQWGIADVEDCVEGARWLAREGVVDGARMAIRGGSAGGFTVLAALAFHDTFAAGASHYGIGDLEALAQDTHKFESRYLDQLVGPYPARRDLYVARSPIHHLDGFTRPAIFLQGSEDKVVPPNQAEAMVAALKARGVPVAYLLFEGEGHGFRDGANIKRALEAELWFYGRIFGFAPADDIQPVPMP
jgi:dipeptidyl aminopeptidase/acylaminoacyl peptidase